MHGKPRDECRRPRSIPRRHQRHRAIRVVAVPHHFSKSSSRPVLLVRGSYTPLVRRHRLHVFPRDEDVSGTAVARLDRRLDPARGERRPTRGVFQKSKLTLALSSPRSRASAHRLASNAVTSGGCGSSNGSGGSNRARASSSGSASRETARGTLAREHRWWTLARAFDDARAP